MSRFAKLVNAQFQNKQGSSQAPKSSQPPPSSQPPSINQLSQDRQLPLSSQPLEQAGARHESRQPQENRQLPQDKQKGVDLIASLPEVNGRLELPYQVVDHLLRLLDPMEQAVYIQLYRLSWGFNKPTCSISNPKLAERTGMPESTVKKTLAKLRAKGLVKKTGINLGYGKDQGIDFWVTAPSSQLQRSSQLQESRQLPQDHNKINTFKENTHKGSVRRSSKFSLEECRKYAEHLQRAELGITNPGGYATIIFRTGEADEQIESFLNKPSPIDSNGCPDCGGSGYFYPEGPEKGVKICKHERLKNG